MLRGTRHVDAEGRLILRGPALPAALKSASLAAMTLIGLWFCVAGPFGASLLSGPDPLVMRLAGGALVAIGLTAGACAAVVWGLRAARPRHRELVFDGDGFWLWPALSRPVLTPWREVQSILPRRIMRHATMIETRLRAPRGSTDRWRMLHQGSWHLDPSLYGVSAAELLALLEERRAEALRAPAAPD